MKRFKIVIPQHIVEMFENVSECSEFTLCGVKYARSLIKYNEKIIEEDELIKYISHLKCYTTDTNLMDYFVEIPEVSNVQKNTELMNQFPDGKQIMIEYKNGYREFFIIENGCFYKVSKNRSLIRYEDIETHFKGISEARITAYGDIYDSSKFFEERYKCFVKSKVHTNNTTNEGSITTYLTKQDIEEYRVQGVQTVVICDVSTFLRQCVSEHKDF